MKRNRSRFTMIELLMVIAVIAILTSIMLPGLRKAKQFAYSATCGNNLKQIAMAGLMYADEWDDCLPCHGRWNGYTEYGYDHTSDTQWWTQAGFSTVKQHEGESVLHCPQGKASLRPLRFPTSTKVYYNLNKYLGARDATGTPPIPRTRHLTVKKWWFADGKMGSNADGYWLFSNMDSYGYVPWPWEYSIVGHPSQTANFTFGDGHVESLKNSHIVGMTNAERDEWRGTED